MPPLDVLISHPAFGSLWLSDAVIEDGHVTGETWDLGGAGDPYLPDDYSGEAITMNFPATCIRKVEVR